VVVVPSPPPLLEPGSPVLVPGTTPEVVDGSVVLVPGSPVVDVVAVVVVASVVVVGLVPVVTPFDSEPPDGSVVLPVALAPVVVGPVLPSPDDVSAPVPDAVPSSVPEESPPQDIRRRPRGAAQSDRRSCTTIPNMRPSYAEFPSWQSREIQDMSFISPAELLTDAPRGMDRTHARQ
jgi:hypothetical protein